jgi:5-methylcytosine-specific restriction endonuclease McrA
MEIGNTQLVQTVELLVKKETECTVELLEYLGELDRRQIYLELGYASCFDFCTRHLHYSEPGANRRIRCARAMRDYAVCAVKERLLSRSLTLTTLSLVAGELTPETAYTILEAVAGMSKREVEGFLSERRPRSSVPKEVVKPLHIVRSVPAPPSLPLTSPAPLLAETPTPEPEATKEERFELRFTVNKDTMEKVRQMQEISSRQTGAPLSLEEILMQGVELYLDKQDPVRRQERRDVRAEKKVEAKKAEPSPKVVPRRIPAAVRDEIFVRDGSSCCYVSPSGVRCSSRMGLEIDHVHPFGIGGGHECDNLRVLCKAHNRHRVKVTFPGDDRHLQARNQTCS